MNFNKGQLFAFFPCFYSVLCVLISAAFLEQWNSGELFKCCSVGWLGLKCPVLSMVQLYLTSSRQIGVLLAFSSLCSQQKEKPLESYPGDQGTARRSWSGAHLVFAPSLGGSVSSSNFGKSWWKGCKWAGRSWERKHFCRRSEVHWVGTRKVVMSLLGSRRGRTFSNPLVPLLQDRRQKEQPPENMKQWG